MKKYLSVATLAALAIGSTLALCGCDDETHADPAIQKSMEDQRSRMAPGGDKGGLPTKADVGKGGAAPAPAPSND